MSCHTISPAIDYSGCFNHIAGPIDDFDFDYSNIRAEKYLNLWLTEPGDVTTLQSQTSVCRDYFAAKNVELCFWTDFSKEVVTQLMDFTNFRELKEFISDFFDLTKKKDVLKENAISDMYAYAVQFTRKQKFNLLQASTLLSIIKNVFEVTIETPFDNLHQTFTYFKELLLCHSVHRPPLWADVFDATEAELIMNYMMNTYFKHFRLYKCAFTPNVEMEITMHYSNVDDEKNSVQSSISDVTSSSIPGSLHTVV